VVVTAPQLSAVQAPQPGFGQGQARSATTPLYDALVHEYRQALRCVPGDNGSEERCATLSAVSAAAASSSSSSSPSSPHELGILPGYARRAAGAVPRQVSRHRGASGDAPSPVAF